MSKRQQRQTHMACPPTPVVIPRHSPFATWLLIALVLLTPFISLSGVFFEPLYDTTLRRLVLFGGGGALTALMVFAWARGRRITWRWHVLDGLVAVFLLGLLVSAVRSPYPHLAFGGPLWSQIALPFMGIGVLLYVGVKGCVRTPEDVQRVVGAMVLAGGVMAVIGLLDRQSGHGFAAAYDPPRLTALLRNPMFTGLYFAMLVPLAVGSAVAATRRGWRIVLLCCAGLMLLALVLTLARSAWVGVAASLLLLGPALAWRSRGNISRTAWIGMGAALIVLMLVALLTPTVRERLRSMTNLRDGTVQSRFVYMQSAWQMFRARPLTGWGVGTFTLIAPEFRPATYVEEGGISINRVAALALPHNLPLQLAAETGLLGVIPFLLLLGVAITAGVFIRGAAPPVWGVSWGLAGLLCAYLVTNLFAFDISITLANAWIGLGLLSALLATARPSPAAPAFHAPVATSLYVLAGLLTLGTVAWVAGDGMTAHATLQGTHQAFSEARAWAHQQDFTRCRQVSDAGIAQLTQALDMPLVPTFVSARYLALAYREQMLLLRASDTARAAYARKQMFRYGHEALRRMDRDPEMLLFLCIEYLDYERVPDARKDADTARALLQQLLVYLPNSAQAHLLRAKMQAYDQHLADAEATARHALTLDPKYNRAHLWLARILNIQIDQILLGKTPGRDPVALVSGRDAAGLALATDACTHFTQAHTLGTRLTDSDRMKYATLLFLTSQPDQGIAEGRQLTDPRQHQILRDRVNYFYTVRKQAQQGQTIIAQLQQPEPPITPPAVSPPPPSPATPAMKMPWLPAMEP